jgi:hypothetical protein
MVRIAPEEYLPGIGREIFFLRQCIEWAWQISRQVSAEATGSN